MRANWLINKLTDETEVLVVSNRYTSVFRGTAEEAKQEEELSYRIVTNWDFSEPVKVIYVKASMLDNDSVRYTLRG